MIQADWIKSLCLRVRLVSWEADSGVLICYVQTMDTEEHFLYTRPTYLQKSLKLNIHQLTQLLVVH